MELCFFKGSLANLETLNSMFTAAAEKMLCNGIDQWDDIYPTEKDILNDIERGQLFVGRIGDDIAVSFTLNDECDEQYLSGKWNHPDLSFAVIHRLCVSPAYQNRGIAHKTMLYIEYILREQNIFTVRLDVFSLNPYAIRLYERLGYKRVGSAFWRKGEFYLMEKNITEE